MDRWYYHGSGEVALHDLADTTYVDRSVIARWDALLREMERGADVSVFTASAWASRPGADILHNMPYKSTFLHAQDPDMYYSYIAMMRRPADTLAQPDGIRGAHHSTVVAWLQRSIGSLRISEISE